MNDNTDSVKDPLDVQIGGSHYRAGGIQPVQYIEANSLAFLEGCVVKRVTRHDRDGGKGRQDIEKAIHELQLLLALRYPSDPSREIGSCMAAHGDWGRQCDRYAKELEKIQAKLEAVGFPTGGPVEQPKGDVHGPTINITTPDFVVPRDVYREMAERVKASSSAAPSSGERKVTACKPELVAPFGTTSADLFAEAFKPKPSWVDGIPIGEFAPAFYRKDDAAKTDSPDAKTDLENQKSEAETPKSEAAFKIGDRVKFRPPYERGIVTGTIYGFSTYDARIASINSDGGSVYLGVDVSLLTLLHETDSTNEKAEPETPKSEATDDPYKISVEDAFPIGSEVKVRQQVPGYTPHEGIAMYAGMPGTVVGHQVRHAGHPTMIVVAIANKPIAFFRNKIVLIERPAS